MAVRQLQRLLKDQLDQVKEDATSSSEEEEDDAPSGAAFNPFDLLTDVSVLQQQADGVYR